MRTSLQLLSAAACYTDTVELETFWLAAYGVADEATVHAVGRTHGISRSLVLVVLDSRGQRAVAHPSMEPPPLPRDYLGRHAVASGGHEAQHAADAH